MKPIYLKMTAFGPYKSEEIIRFEELKENRLFVISGPTGAGKTSIFDAICFALYGTSSGSDRENARMLRSDFADDDMHTAVELIFEIRDCKYRVLRQIGHVKEGRKTATGEKYELYEILQDGTEVAVVERQRVSDINPKLEEIIGLSYDQFSQIVMLPQGEFRKLLTSQSENKEAILRKIFKTDRYGKMAKVLEQRKLKAEADAKAVKATRDSYIEQIAGVLPQREATLFSLLENKGNIYQIQEALLEEQQYYNEERAEQLTQFEQAKQTFQIANEKYIAAKSINEQLEALEAAKKQLELLTSQLDYFEQIKSRAEAAQRANTLVFLDDQCINLHKTLKAKEQLLTQVQQQLQEAEQIYATCKQHVENEKANEPMRNQLTDMIQKLETMKPLYEQIDALQQQLQQTQRKVQQYTLQIEQTAEKLEQQKNSLLQYKEAISKAEQEVAKRPAIIEQLHQLKQVVTLVNQYAEKQAEQKVAEVYYLKAKENYDSARAQYDQAEMQWLTNQAYVLASNLLDGEACPVCGSTDHPNKNKEHTHAIDQAKIEQYKKQLTQVEAVRNDQALKYNVMKEKVFQLQEQLEQLQVNVENASDYENQLRQLTVYNEQLQQQSLRLQQLKQEEATLQEKRQLTEQQLKQIEKYKVQYEKESIAYQANFEQMKSHMDPSIVQLNELENQLRNQKARLLQLEKAWEQAQIAMQQSETALATKKQAVEFTAQQLQELQQELAITKEQFVEKLKAAHFENYTKYKEALLSESEIKQLQDQYLNFSNQYHATLQKVKDESERLKDSKKVDLTQGYNELQQLKQQEEQCYEKLKHTERLEEYCHQFNEKLSKVADDIYNLEQISNQITDVHNLLKGNNTKKISFERYVQMGYLEQITEAANARLRNLSNGQYMLICSDRQESHGRQSGLSLDVYDSYTGQTRDVKSLSGGEKFNASLCLALGMADVIQSYQGNVRIDTMFIDEGFGSLDEESLMRAIDTLIELQNAGRMIGVISHVSELKDAIPAVLQVMKSKAGYSSTKFVVH